MRRLRPADEAVEDLVQQTVLKALIHADQFRQKGEPQVMALLDPDQPSSAELAASVANSQFRQSRESEVPVTSCV